MSLKITSMKNASIQLYKLFNIQTFTVIEYNDYNHCCYYEVMLFAKVTLHV